MLKEIKNSLELKIEKFSKDIREDIYTAYLVYKDPRTPLLPKILIILIIGYFLSPIDLIPDFIPFFGYLDDLIIIPLGLILVKKMIDMDIWRDCKKQAIKNLPKFKYVKHLLTLLIMAFWALLAYYAIKLILKII